ncbi:hypothetical protein [Laspinema olomoucense]|uniref:Uncharacterized protein n=1 Tax=Laspinema olomoucense D3b TaxID=2953688 RepID=A0ABT2N4J9_9CYAN|nr:MULTISPECIES: hypothetical protein [unclassified Laspinema]MCT7970946.1 hypothetical protein [Laspinema sp. D3d]MCT7976236.1 hypothetical protein [Laspinema sp. D3b]MCT7989984.1 hypothetical protein [Laspinema sp. D3a]MCT7995739.1 hypothetical protein [Laspinema sp. D3c]
MKPKHVLAGILSTAAVATGILITSEAQASGCPFAKGLNQSTQNLSNATGFHNGTTKAAFLGGAVLAAGASILAIRRLAGDRSPEHPEFSSTDELIPSSEVFPTEVTEPQASVVEEKELTLVR